MRVRFFGRLTDHFGEEVEIDATEALRISELRCELSTRFLNAGDRLQSSSVRACVGDAIVPEDFIVEPGGTVEFWPPVSGG